MNGRKGPREGEVILVTIISMRKRIRTRRERGRASRRSSKEVCGRGGERAGRVG